VAAADDWGGEMRVKDVRPSMAGSWERAFHDAALPGPALLDLAATDGCLREALEETRLERFIGVIYRPETERWSHYAEARLGRQFDGWVWFDETRALTPLSGAREDGISDTFPFGL
jgi:erythromycin esterase-like protein